MEIIQREAGQAYYTIIEENLFKMLQAAVYNPDLYWRAHPSVITQFVFLKFYQVIDTKHTYMGIPVEYDSDVLAELGAQGDIQLCNSTKCLAVLAERR